MLYYIFIFSVSLLTVILYLLAAYSLGEVLFDDSLGRAEKLLFGFAILTAGLIVTGYFLSFLGAFIPVTSAIVLYSFIIIPIALLIRRMGSHHLRDLISESLRNTPTQIAAAAVVFVFCIGLLFESRSILTQGWDRGQHFADCIHLMLNGRLYQRYPGTDYRPFYFEGPTCLLAMFMMGITQACGISPLLAETDLTLFSLQFLIPWGMLVSLWPLVPYAVVKRETGSIRAASIAALLTLTISGIEYSRMGSIGTSYGHLLTVVVFIMVTLRDRGVISGWRVRLPIILTTAAVVASHIIPLYFIAFLLLFYHTANLLITRTKVKEFFKNIIETGVAGVMGVGIIYFFNNALYWGILDAVARRAAGSQTTDVQVIYLGYIVPQIERVIRDLDFVIIPFLILGVAGLWRLRSKTIALLGLVGVTFLILPLLPFPRALYYLTTPAMSLAAIGMEMVLQLLERLEPSHPHIPVPRSQILRVFLVGIVIIPSIIVQTHYALDPGPYRMYSELDEDRFHPIELAQWVRANIDPEKVIAFPNSGPVARYFETVVTNKVYFADWRFSDLPTYRDIAALYGHTSNFSRQLSIVEQYNVSVIIQGYSRHLRNKSCWYSAFPGLKTYVLWDGTYIVRVLKP